MFIMIIIIFVGVTGVLSVSASQPLKLLLKLTISHTEVSSANYMLQMSIFRFFKDG